ncbi:cytochrome c-type biogenesis protein [Hazenella coriacea]|uniref:Cytochrome c-type biogenesis protein n=2 Tax=Hazenella coriacea TaxID=1179467 RepID=A0A4V2UV87_9BACL|nr:cytochrome c-type biogenesis protein [Hazenella coriacea]
MQDLTIFFAFAAGLISFFSPCIFPLIPVYVSQLTGGEFSEGKINVEKKVILSRSIFFVLGFSFIFILLGASASAMGQFLSNQREVIEKFGGILVIIFGLQMTGLIQLRFLMKEKRWLPQMKQKGGITSLLMGIAFGAGWTPCVGLALSSILLMASSSETVYSGMLYLLIYSLGLAIPFIALSFLLTYTLTTVKKMNRYLPVVSKVGGWILIIMGFLLFTDQMTQITAWLAKYSYTW